MQMLVIFNMYHRSLYLKQNRKNSQPIKDFQSVYKVNYLMIKPCLIYRNSLTSDEDRSANFLSSIILTMKFQALSQESKVNIILPINLMTKLAYHIKLGILKQSSRETRVFTKREIMEFQSNEIVISYYISKPQILSLPRNSCIVPINIQT